jgi:hypothetical protein
MSSCKICNKPIVLVPSASERAAKYGGKPSDYTNLFSTHSACSIKKRQEDTSALMAQITAKAKRDRVTYPTSVKP